MPLLLALILRIVKYSYNENPGPEDLDIGHPERGMHCNGRRGVADLSNALRGSAFESLKDKSIFSSLRVDEELETIVWPNGADLVPESVYFQAFKDDSSLQEQFRAWGYA